MSLPDFYPFTKKWHHKPYDAISLSCPAMSMAGKNIVITGAGSGIGRAVALAFAEAGAASLTLLGRRAGKIEETASAIASTTPRTKVLCKPTDITSPERLSSTFNAITSELGSPDILIHSAATLPSPGRLAQASPSAVEDAFKTNAFGALYTAQAFLAHTPAPEPTIIDISSALAHMDPLRSMGLYASSKAASVKLLDYLQVENPGCRIVHLQPGVVDTEMNRSEMDVRTEDKPELPGQFCVWLASPEAAFLNGRFVWANWDVGELKERAEEIKGSRLLTMGLDGVPM